MTDWTRHVVLITSADGKRHGSGFVARRAGVVAHVVTCAHVVGDLGDGLLANGRPAKVLWDGTKDGIDLAVLAADGLTEEPLTLTRGAAVGDAVVAVGFTQVDRGRRATAVPATIREATQLTYDPARVVKKHAGWLLGVADDGITDGFSGGPVVHADTGLVIGVLGLRGAGTADVIGIANLAAWRDAPGAVSALSDEVARLQRSSLRIRGASFALGAALAAVVAFVATRRQGNLEVKAPLVLNAPLFGSSAGPEDVVVSASLGWQRSRAEYKAGDVLCLEPSGHVAVSHPDLEHLSEVWRPLLIKYAPAGTRLAQEKRVTPAPVLTAANGFRFGWAGPEGTTGVRDGLFDECRLAPAEAWGALLVTELRELGYPDLATRDPLQLLQEDQRAVADVRVLGARREFTLKTDAYLAFMVNDAVLSPRFAPAHPVCAEPTQALDLARRALATDLNHRLDVVAAPLLPFIDNGGEFRVRIRKGACAPINVLRTRPPG